MKLKIFSLSALAAGAFLISSCEKELDLKPTDTIQENNAFISLEDVQRGVNAAHGRYSVYAGDMYANALTSDEAALGVDNAGQGALTYRFQYSADGTTGGDLTPMFGGYYALIDQCNRVLPKINTVTLDGAPESRRGILRGQLLALRAIAHFGLLQAYSPRYNASEPLGQAIMIESDVLAKKPRNTMGDVMAQIESDLREASGLLQAAPFSDTVMNKVNIAGYHARIALYKGEYQRAIDSATVVINSGVKTLATSASAFSGIWTDLNQNELLFRRRYASAGDGAIGSAYTTAGNFIYISPSSKLIQAYTSTDVRRNVFIGGSSGQYYLNKFYNSSKGGRVVDIKAMRVAEMYLIRAEAYAKLPAPNIASGAADLNTLRTARIGGYTPETFGSAATLVSAILEERFKELCFEGFRFYDLKRNNLPVQRNAADANPAWQTLDAASFRFVYPIPREEIIANPNMVQNPGY